MTLPISVVHIITKLELGGAQQVALFTVSHLDTSRYRPILVIGESGYLDAEAKAMPAVECYQVSSMVRPIRPFQDACALYRLTKLLDSLRPMIVHTHSSKAGILGRWAARLSRVPIIVHTIHGFGFTPYQRPSVRRLLIALERITSRFTTKFFVVSEANRRLGIKLGLFSAERSCLLRPGIDVSAFRQAHVNVAEKRQELGVGRDQPLIGMVAPFKPQKAPLDFVRVAARVVRYRPDARFLMVGDGDLRTAIEQEIERLSLSSAFVLTGWRRDIPEIMHCLNVFVLTSRWEGLPRVYLEALASGVPVVGTDVDGASEVIRDGVNGYLAAPGDIQGIAERVLYLLEHPGEAKRMGQNGRSLSSEFDIYEMVRQQEREYEHLLAELETRTMSTRAVRNNTHRLES